MHDMHKSGCKAFTDDKKSISRNEVIKIALLYSKDIDALIMNYPNDKSIANNGFMHEGIVSTMLGLKGIPALAEEIMVDRDINLCEYTNSRLHLSYISTKNSVQKVKNAKTKGLKVTTDVALHNLFLTDKAVNNFDTRYKVIPPLRTNKDNKALIKGLKDGTIDVISTDHSPITDEYKKIDFDNAANGIIGLETALSDHTTLRMDYNRIIYQAFSRNEKGLGGLSVDQSVSYKNSIDQFLIGFSYKFSPMFGPDQNPAQETEIPTGFYVGSGMAMTSSSFLRSFNRKDFGKLEYRSQAQAPQWDIYCGFGRNVSILPGTQNVI